MPKFIKDDITSVNDAILEISNQDNKCLYKVILLYFLGMIIAPTMALCTSKIISLLGMIIFCLSAIGLMVNGIKVFKDK